MHVFPKIICIFDTLMALNNFQLIFYVIIFVMRMIWSIKKMFIINILFYQYSSRPKSIYGSVFCNADYVWSTFPKRGVKPSFWGGIPNWRVPIFCLVFSLKIQEFSAITRKIFISQYPSRAHLKGLAKGSQFETTMDRLWPLLMMFGINVLKKTQA